VNKDIAIAALILIVGMSCTAIGGLSMEAKMQRAAVRNGAAKWVVSEDGRVEFKWNGGAK